MLGFVELGFCYRIGDVGTHLLCSPDLKKAGAKTMIAQLLCHQIGILRGDYRISMWELVQKISCQKCH